MDGRGADPCRAGLEADPPFSEGRPPWSMFFAGIVTYRSASQAMFQTAFHRRLDIWTNEFSLCDTTDASLEFIGRRLR